MSVRLHGSHSWPPPTSWPTRHSTSVKSMVAGLSSTVVAIARLLGSAVDVDDEAAGDGPVRQAPGRADRLGQADLMADHVEKRGIEVMGEPLPGGHAGLPGRHHAVNSEQADSAQDERHDGGREIEALGK